MDRYKIELKNLIKQEDKMIQAIMDGFANEKLKTRLNAIDGKKHELEALLETNKPETIIFHPNMADRYHQEIRDLVSNLQKQSSRTEAATLLRSLIDKIILTPTEDGKSLTVDLIGDLAGILSVATSRDKRTIQFDLSEFKPVPQTAQTVAYPSGSSSLASKHLAMVAGGRSDRQLSLSESSQMAMVAGARNLHNLQLSTSTFKYALEGHKQLTKTWFSACA